MCEEAKTIPFHDLILALPCVWGALASALSRSSTTTCVSRTPPTTTRNTPVTPPLPEKTPETDIQAFDLAVKACQKNGITSFHDAGIPKETITLYEKMKLEGKMNTRIYAMLTGWDKELLNNWYEKGVSIDPDHLFTIRSVKLNCDGALGSRGAWLLEPYSDRPNHFGHETLPMEFVKETALNGLKHGFQVCAHAIGDRANREILDRYELAFKEIPEAITSELVIIADISLFSNMLLARFFPTLKAV